jgi:hypothetical protein
VNFNPICEALKLPRSDRDVDVNIPFSETELLFRRAFPQELNSKGELVPTQLESFSFSKDVVGAPSFLRSAYASAADVLHKDCAGKKDVSSCSALQMFVSELPGPLVAGDGKKYSFWPLHQPLPDCGAHSVISSHLQDDPAKAYAKPSGAVLSKLKLDICRVLKPCEPQPGAKARVQASPVSDAIVK